jgi:hypothetical protein
MSGSSLAVVVIPIVVAIALAFWIFIVYWAEFHPEHKSRSRLPGTEVSGGAFEARVGGRQLMPHHGTTTPEEEAFARSVGIPAPRTEAAPAASAGASAQPAGSQAAEEPHLVAGSKLR